MTINDKVLAYCEAICTQDSKLFESLWTKQASCTLVSVGVVFKGYESIYKDFLINAIQKTYETIKLIPEDIAITYQDETHAIVMFRYHTECALRSDGSPFGISGLETQVWKMEGDWKLVHVHYSKV